MKEINGIEWIYFTDKNFFVQFHGLFYRSFYTRR